MSNAGRWVCADSGLRQQIILLTLVLRLGCRTALFPREAAAHRAMHKKMQLGATYDVRKYIWGSILVFDLALARDPRSTLHSLLDIHSRLVAETTRGAQRA
jgi:hypothetical protein